MKKFKIAIVDDHIQILASLKMTFSMFEELEVLFTAKNGVELLRKIELEGLPELIVMDIDMPEMNGIQATYELRNQYGDDVKVLVLTVFDDDEKIFNVIKAGANGYLLKDEKPEKIVQSIHDALEGGAPMSPSIAYKTLKLLKQSNLDINKNTSSEFVIEFNLTDREVEIAKLIADGLSYKKIAENLFISDKTVKKHIENIYKKLRISSKMEVAKLLQKYNK
ncbi:MAG: response regulator transcription factor [Cytophagales bacterium]